MSDRPLTLLSKFDISQEMPSHGGKSGAVRAVAGDAVPVADVTGLGVAVLESLGARPDDARAQIQQLIEGDLRGRPSHGMQRLPTLVARIDNGVLDPRARPTVESRGAGGIEVDGCFGFGPVAANRALDALRPATRRAGVGFAAIRAAGHIGMLAPYLEQLAGAGLVGLAFTTSEALVHPAGGRLAMVGTNPIGIGIPAFPEPFVFDMSTAAISAGEVIAHRERGHSLPEGSAVDPAGNPTADPDAALAGAISPFGGAKGYGLGLGIELLVALLTDSALGTRVRGTLDVDQPATKGDLFLAVDPAALPATASPERIGAYLEELRDSPAAPGFERVMVPGDRMREERRRRLAAGLSYPPATRERLAELGRRAGVAGVG